MYRFFYAVFALMLSFPVGADDAKSPFTFVSEHSTTITGNTLEAAVFPVESYTNMHEQTRMERRRIRERFLDMLGVSRFVPHGNFTTFGLKSHWTLALPDEETVSLRVTVHW